jgi:putative GTP pyrophosphokinase
MNKFDEFKVKEKLDNYLILGEVLKKELNEFIQGKVDKFRLEYRIKDFENFKEKIVRKGYYDPFIEMEDICGVRIVCYYSSDLEIISKIIKKEFEILKSVNKNDLLETDEFGYRSIHFIVKIKKDKIKKHKYQNLKDLKAEIQVRTLLMDVHASIEHDLTYKKGTYVPKKFHRRLSQLSAILETVDSLFDELKDDIKQYHDKLDIADVIEYNKEMDITNLQAILDIFFPEREKNSDHIEGLLYSLEEYNKYHKEDPITLKTIFRRCAVVEIDLIDMERKYFANMEVERKWDQAESLIAILSTIPSYNNWGA